MTAQIIDGKAIAEQVKQQLKQQIQQRLALGKRPPGLAVILVGENPASQVYIRNKQRACEQVGIYSISQTLSEKTSQNDLLHQIDKLNDDPTIDGILVQLPLPSQIDPSAVMARIRPDKDVDGFHAMNMGNLVLRTPVLRPCTPKGIMTMLQHIDQELKGMEAVVIGQSNIVGRPIAMELLMASCTVTICHSKTKDLPGHIRRAELVVAAVGRPNMVQGDWIKPNAIVIDVGINRLDNGQLVGDVDFATAKQHASWITPVPGGVGPMTIASLLENTFYANQHLHEDNN